MPSPKRLFLLDAYALIFRGYYAFIKNPRINSKGMDTSAIMGFMNSLLDVIKRERPDHLAVAFDKDGSTDRLELFADYKANRDETPEAIKIAVPYIQRILKAMHIPVIELSGYEADDLIGTLAKQAEKQGFDTFMVTPDKDFAQLVSDHIFIYKPARDGGGSEVWGIKEVQQNFEVERPDQVIDFLAMKGDAVDNIPGLPGVGDKTAKKFIQQYGSLEGLLAHTHELSGKMKENIEAHADKGILSKKLARIMTDLPVAFNEKDFELSKPDIPHVMEIFEELEFRRLKENLMKAFQTDLPIEVKPDTLQQAQPKEGTQFDLFASPGSGQKLDSSSTTASSLKEFPHFYQSVEGELGQRMLLEKLLQQSSVCFDTETTSINALEAELVGIAFSWQPGKGYYLAFPEDQKKAQALLNDYRPFFENENIEKVGHNLKYDIKVLSNYQIAVKGALYDTMIAHYLINPDMRHGMDMLAETYLNYKPISITELIGKKGKNQGSMREVDLADQKEYAVEDADVTLRLKEFFTPEMEEGKLTSLFQKVEMPLVQVLAAMEIEGIRVDVSFLNQLSQELEKDIAVLETRIYELTGEEFNLASPKQLGTILFEKLALVRNPKKTKTGQYTTSEEILSELAKEHEVASKLLDWRSLQKLKSTYVDALPGQINPKTGKVHTIYSQAVAATGRLSSNDPNLQNIPIRTERGRQVRRAFVSRDDDFLLLSADYSQIELRLIASLSEDPIMIESFLRGEDIHAATAAKVFGVPLDQVTREQRSQAKTVNFGIIYGVSAFGLSNQTTLSRTEAKELIDAYYKTYPRLKNYIAEQINFAREHGYVETIMGRRRYLKDINSRNAVVRGGAERNAVNAPIQGSAADIIKMAMIEIHKAILSRKLKSKMLLQVHDELVFDVHREEIEELQALVKEKMEAAVTMRVPLLVDAGTGKNWLEAH